MTKIYRVLTIAIMTIIVFASSFSTDASPAYPGLISFIQPDGTSLRMYLKGDEKVKWGEMEDGYSIMFNDQGFYEYAVTNGKGDMVPSGVIAKNAESRTPSNLAFLSSVTKHKTYSLSQISIAKQIWNISNEEKNGAKAFPTTGNRKLICILIGFTDKAFTKTNADFNNLYNQIGYSANSATGSVKDYFYEASYTQFNLSVDVFGPYTASNTMAYFGGNDAGGSDLRPRELAAEAVNLADGAGVNFANYDNDNNGTVDGVYVIYAGYGEESGASANCIWAHAWNLATTLTKDAKTISKYSCSSEFQGTTGTTMTNIGVICHEFGHVLGAPDFYDTDYATGGSYDGTGDWDLQAGGSWNNNGITPPHPNPYTKCYIYNWAVPTLLTTGATVTLNNSTQNSGSFYRFNTTTANEYYLLENKQKIGFNAYVPGKGLLIYHVDQTYTTTNSSKVNATSHQGMYIVPATSTTANGIDVAASSKVNTTGCPYPGTGNKTTFTDATTPNSKSWAGANTAKPITSITENTTNKTVTLNFMGGYTCTPPTSQATAFSATAITNTTMTANWTRGNGTAVMVVARAGSAVNNDPFNGVVYAANAAFGSGTEIGTGNFVVFNGTGTSVNITNLTPGTTYYFAIYELTAASNCFKTPGLLGNALTTGTAPCVACVPTSTSDDATGVTNVTFNTINNSSTGVDAYTNNSATITTVNKGQTYPLSVKVNTFGNYLVVTKAWIDWNQDCTFDPATEEYVLGNATNVTDGLTASSPLSILIPATALTGNTKMRIRATYNVPPTSCGDQSYSEAEDYTLNVVAAGCTPVAITTQPTASQNACNPGGASFTVVAATGTAPITYQWQYYNGATWNSVVNGTPAGATYTNGTTATMTVAGITAVATHQYRCYLTNCSGANNATSTTANLIINALPTAGITNNSGGATQVTCALPAINVTATGGTSYAWSGGSTPATAANSFNTNATYTVTVTAANSCTATSNIVITKNITAPTAAITNNSGGATQVTCALPTINVTATGGTSYAWSGGATPTTAANSFNTNATYTVTVTAANSCTATSNIVITKNITAPTAVITNNSGGATQVTCALPTINVTATGGTSYAWSGGATPTTAGNSFNTNATYTVTVTGANGCTGTSNITITQDASAVTAGITNNSGSTMLTCALTSISVTATGGTSYIWSGGNTPTTAANSFTTPATYTVTVTAANGCTATSSITLTQDVTAPTPVITNNSGGATQVTCALPTINVTATGGTSYAWSGGSTPATAANSFNTNATYTVTVTAANGCTATSNIVITKNITIPTAGITNNSGGATQVTCALPAINVTATGGTSYAWSGGSTPATAANSFNTNATYTVTVTAANSCTGTSNIVITKNITTPTAGITNNSGGATQVTCALPAINVTATGGTSYAWSGGATPTTAANSFNAAGTYTVTVTGTNGCTATSSITITQDASVVTAGITNNSGSTMLTCALTAISVTATGGTSYIWSGGNTPTTAANSFTAPATYTVTVTATGGCTATLSLTIIQDITAPLAIASSNSPICVGGDLLLNTNNSGTAYSWNGPNGFSSDLESPILNNSTMAISGTYNVIVTGSNGCTSSAQTIVVVNSTPIAQFSYIANGLTATFTNSSTGASSYNWDLGGINTTDASPIYTFPSDGQYTVSLVAIGTGCTDTISQIISVAEVGIATNEINNINIYPNPAKEKLTIHWNKVSQNGSLQIFDVTGKLIVNSKISGQQTEINTSNYPAGCYHLRIIIDNNVMNRKFMVE